LLAVGASKEEQRKDIAKSTYLMRWVQFPDEENKKL
jgi:hypothetical protein